MVIADTLEGVVHEQVSFHYDLSADVLYLRLLTHLESPAIGEDTPDDLTLFRDEETDEVVGLDILSWWKRFGDGGSRDSIDGMTRKIEPFALRLLAEAEKSAEIVA